MADLRTRLKETIARLVKAIIEYHKLMDLPGVPKAHPPASETQIEKYEKHLDLKLPPSYREFLKLHNGYDGLAWPGDMVSIKDVMPGGKWYDDMQHWKKTTARYGRGEVLSGIVIGQAGEPNDWVYLDPHAPSKGKELTVVNHSASSAGRYPDLIEYFEFLMQALGPKKDSP